MKPKMHEIAEKFCAEAAAASTAPTSAAAAYSYAVNRKAINKYLNLIKLHEKDEMMHGVCCYVLAFSSISTVEYRVIFLASHKHLRNSTMHFTFLHLFMQLFWCI